jgi:DNA-binding transcriptional ArsR family regulator
MSVTIDIAGLQQERIVFAPSPLAELGTALHVLAEPGHHPGAHAWATAVNASLKPDLADRLCEADFLWRTTFSDILLGFAGLRDASAQPGTTLTEDLDLLDKLDDEEFVTASLEFTCTGLNGTEALRSPLSDPALRERSIELASARGPQQREFTERLLDDPPAVRAWMRRLFEDCDQAFFAHTRNRVRGRLAADSRDKTELLRRRGLAAALEAISPALSTDERCSVIEVDKLVGARTTAVNPAVGPGVTFVPSVHQWPHLLVLHRHGWRPVVHYPLPGRELPGALSVDQFVLRMEALAHPMRMRLCTSLARAPYTTSELADLNAVSAPEVSRHLAALKKAGLITSRRRGRYVQYQLDLRVVGRLGSDFLETVLR